MVKDPAAEEARTLKDIVYEAIAGFHADVTHPRFDALEKQILRVHETVRDLAADTTDLKRAVRDVHRGLRDLEWDTSTREEHDQLHERLGRLERSQPTQA